MKRIIAVLLALLLALGCCVANAEETAEPLYATTKSFLAYMESMGMPPTYVGTDVNNSDVVSFGLYMEELNCNVTAYVHFHSDLTSASIYMWDLIEMDIARLGELLIECNTLNSDYRYITFTANIPNQTVHARASLYFTEETAAYITNQYMGNMFNIIEYTLPSLMEYEP